MLSVILAAGKGTRMKSEKPKVLFEAAGKPMLDYVIDAALPFGDVVIITGAGASEVEALYKDKGVIFRRQATQNGTADAVLAAKDLIEKHAGKVLVLNGDMPLIKHETLKTFIDKTTAELAFISVKAADPAGYGRVVRAVSGEVLAIVEEKDASESVKKIKEVNTGVYLAEASLLLERLAAVTNNNAQNEYYLTDIVKGGAAAWCAPEAAEFAGVNDRLQLSQAAKSIWKRRAEELTRQGVTIIDPSCVYLSAEAEFAPDVTLYPHVYVEGASVIKGGVTLRHGVRIVDSEIGEDTVVLENTLIEESRVGAKCKIGPMAHLRPGSVLTGENSIGNYVELKKAVLGKGAKANHLTYLGDATIGGGTNVGCGTITCNYDGFKKHKTEIGENVFVGSDVQFVAPVKIGKGAIIAAGTTVTKDVPEDALAIARVPQTNIESKAQEIRRKKGEV